MRLGLGILGLRQTRVRARARLRVRHSCLLHHLHEGVLLSMETNNRPTKSSSPTALMHIVSL